MSLKKVNVKIISRLTENTELFNQQDQSFATSCGKMTIFPPCYGRWHVYLPVWFKMVTNKQKKKAENKKY